MIGSVFMSSRVTVLIVDPHQNLSAEVEAALKRAHHPATIIRVTDTDVIDHFVGSQNVSVLVNVPATENGTLGSKIARSASISELKALALKAAAIGTTTIVNLVPLPKIDLDRALENETATPTAFAEAAHVNIHHLFLPTLIGQHTSSAWGFIGGIFNACRPVLTIETLAAAILSAASSNQGKIRYLAENKDENPYYRFGSRVVDLAGSAALLVLTSWIMALAAVFIRLESKGSGLFMQKRVGLNGETFTCLKLRTMHKGTPQADSHMVGQSAITRVGAFLRKSKIDELPQLLNILRGDLSFVGPRPCIESLQDVIARRASSKIFDIKPGLTGLAQVRQQDTSVPDAMISSEVLYAASRNLVLDIKIMLATAFGRGFGDKAVHPAHQNLAAGRT